MPDITSEKTRQRKDKLTKSTGYVIRFAPDHPRARHGYVYEHILVAEQTIGRYLVENEEIHHVNRVRSDNRPENLVVCKNHAEHHKIHQRQRAEQECGDPDKRQCTFCKQWDVQDNLKRLNGSAYHQECARLESKRRYDAGLCKRDQDYVNRRKREKRAAAKQAKGATT